MMLSNKRTKVVLGIVAFILLMIGGSAGYYLHFYEENLNKRLPMVVTVKGDRDPEDIAYKFWYTYMQDYKGDNVSSWKRLSDVRFNEFQLLAGDEEEFAVAVTFWAKLEKKNWSVHHSWGKVQKDGTVKDIQWTLRIKRTGENEYTLKRIKPTTATIAGLPPVKDKYQKEAGIDVPDETNRYQIRNGKLEVTYDDGGQWQAVPVALGELFQGDYSGSKKRLIEGSYFISPKKTGFVIGEGDNVNVLLSDDKGETWDKVHIPSTPPRVRLRLLGFTSEQHGYVILTGDRTMSFEAHAIYKTNDGGESWVKTGSVQETNLMVTGGGFINDKLGFMSFGSVRNNGMEYPSLYRTNDGGKHWDKVELPIPAEYQGIFTVAQVPTFDGSQGTLLVNQGPNGDYQGGNVLARFISIDEGATWSFANLVDPDHVLEE
ncbi:hypothetical protein MUO14_16875 [Halobacillus shinanisalinarum]|uniref:DUF6242 domain-containing protein n=1 Tax=Halobacillus shinanisalinarum TaxID=2932258 RepID=A0ABY4GVM1_9BACI|nr:sialidase family protein [Halobacillus shinanisalinarum]UOQ92153.1 hypothetical protein MUO14_16875 [Halobacillus shinanisalinarum]